MDRRLNPNLALKTLQDEEEGDGKKGQVDLCGSGQLQLILINFCLILWAEMNRDTRKYCTQDNQLKSHNNKAELSPIKLPVKKKPREYQVS